MWPNTLEYPTRVPTPGRGGGGGGAGKRATPTTISMKIRDLGLTRMDACMLRLIDDKCINFKENTTISTTRTARGSSLDVII